MKDYEYRKLKEISQLEFDKISEVVDYVRANEKPLVLYYFGKKNEKKVLDYCLFGGGCVNETIMHLCEDKLPFGGVGNSELEAITEKKVSLHLATKQVF